MKIQEKKEILQMKLSIDSSPTSPSNKLHVSLLLLSFSTRSAASILLSFPWRDLSWFIFLLPTCFHSSTLHASAQSLLNDPTVTCLELLLLYRRFRREEEHERNVLFSCSQRERKRDIMKERENCVAKDDVLFSLWMSDHSEHSSIIFTPTNKPGEPNKLSCPPSSVLIFPAHLGASERIVEAVFNQGGITNE